MLDAQTNLIKSFWNNNLFIVLFVILFLFFIVTLWKMTFFSPQQIYSFNSPDGKFEVNVFRKTNFPPNELLDPAITVYVSLINVEMLKQITK